METFSREYLQAIVRIPHDMQDLMRKHHLVLDNLDDPMQKLAFTFYTQLVLLATDAQNYLDNKEKMDDGGPQF